MAELLRVMTPQPRNAETPRPYLRSWITANKVFFDRNQGEITVLGAAYAGEADVDKVEISTDDGQSWQAATFTGPHEPYAWRHWHYIWRVGQPGSYRILSRATDSNGERQPMQASWNKLGYGNNGIEEHGVAVQII